MSFSKEKVGVEQLSQKNENLLERIIKTSTNEPDLVMDYFLGSGTTCAVAQKMRRKWCGIEMADYFDSVVLIRMNGYFMVTNMG
jgi:adenine-specific DNA-methyltransferase